MTSSTLPAEVRDARAELGALLAEAGASPVQRPGTEPAAEPTVVVIGETNRGKSCLVNALLNTADLCPVDAETATSTYVAIRHGVDWTACGCYDDGRPPVPFDVAGLPDWATVNGALPAGVAPPSFVEVRGPVPLLESLTLIDTPGVGGLHGAHSDIATRTATAATALLMVVDAGSPFTSSELEFLQRVAQRVETAVFALTKIDSHRGWREVLAADIALLAKHAPRFASAPFYPVSARLSLMAAQLPDAQAATALRRQSGIAELQGGLQQLVADRSVMLGEANALRGVHSALSDAVLARRDRALVLRAGAGTGEQLRARREELLVKRRAGQRGWSGRLRAQVQHTRVECNHEVAREVRETQAWFRSAVDAADRQILEGLPAQLAPALAAVAARVSAALAGRMRRLVEQVMAELFTPAELTKLLDASAVHGTAPLVIRPLEKRPSGSEDRMMVVAGASGGVGLGRLALMPLALLPGLNLVLVPLTLGLGAGAAWWMARTRGHMADKAHVKQWSAEVFAEARANLDQLVAEQLIDAEHQLGAALDDALAQRVDQLDQELRAVDAALRMDTAARSEQLRTTERELAALLAGQARAAALLTRIRTVRDRR